MPSKRRKPEISTASLFQDKATKKAKTTQSTLLSCIREWAALLPAEPEDQELTTRAVRFEYFSSGITSLTANRRGNWATFFLDVMWLFPQGIKIYKFPVSYLASSSRLLFYSLHFSYNRFFSPFVPLCTINIYSHLDRASSMYGTGRPSNVYFPTARVSFFQGGFYLERPYPPRK